MTPNTEHRTTTTNHQKKVVRNSFSAGGPSGRDAHVFLSTEQPQNVRRPAPLFAPAPPRPAPPATAEGLFARVLVRHGFVRQVLFARFFSTGLFRQVFFARVLIVRVRFARFHSPGFVRQGIFASLFSPRFFSPGFFSPRVGEKEAQNQVVWEK